MTKVIAPVAALLILLNACGGGSEQPDKATVPGVPSTAPVATDPYIGYYSNMVVVDDIPGVEMELWLRADSSYVLRETHRGPEAFPAGTFGRWHVVDGLLATGSGTDKPEFWRVTENGLLNVGEDGQDFTDGTHNLLTRVPNVVMNEIPVMRVRGRYRYAANSHSFEPTGSGRDFPLAVAELALEMEQRFAERKNPQAAFLCGEMECMLTVGPAMEGNGTDEYLYAVRFVRELPPAECE